MLGTELLGVNVLGSKRTLSIKYSAKKAIRGLLDDLCNKWYLGYFAVAMYKLTYHGVMKVVYLNGIKQFIQFFVATLVIQVALLRF